MRYSRYDPLRVLVHARGFAWIGAKESQHVDSLHRTVEAFRAMYRLERHGYFSELNHEIEVVVPDILKDQVSVVFMDDSGKPLAK